MVVCVLLTLLKKYMRSVQKREQMECISHSFCFKKRREQISKAELEAFQSNYWNVRKGNTNFSHPLCASGNF